MIAASEIGRSFAVALGFRGSGDSRGGGGQRINEGYCDYFQCAHYEKERKERIALLEKLNSL